MLPTNVYSFMKKMVSNTENVNVSQYVSPTNTTTSTTQAPGAMGRLRQTLQQAQETVSNRLQARPPQVNTVSQQPPPQPETPVDAQKNIQTPTNETKEEEMPRPGSAGRCRVCVKAMKPDEYSRECTECGLRVCDDCASYSQHADGNETSWRCSVCRRRGVAIIARRVQPGIEQSEALEGVGFETTVRKSPDNRRLTAGGRADSETEVLLLAPKASDIRRHSDVPLRDIAKFQQSQTISAATSQNDLGNVLSVGSGDKVKAHSQNELLKKENKDQLVISNKSGESKSGDKVSRTKQGQVKRQRSYERGASEGTLNLPGNNRGRRASCDLRAIDPNALNLNNNTIQSSYTNQSTGGTTSGSSGSDKPKNGEKHVKHHHHHHGHSGNVSSGSGSSVTTSTSSSHISSSSGRSQGQDTGGSTESRGGGMKNVTSGNTEASNLVIRNDMRRRSVQM